MKIADTYEILKRTGSMYINVETEIANAKDPRSLFILKHLRSILPTKFYYIDAPNRPSAPPVPRPPPPISPEMKDKAKESILRHLPFKTYEDCISKQRSKAYYLSKESLVKKITDTPDLSKLFPKGEHKKLSKEDICKKLI
jgi:hypothetical protein